MRAHPKFLTIAAVLGASAPAFAQSTGEGEPRAAQSAPSGGYPAYPGERHLLVRAVGGGGLQFNNAWGQGLFSSVYAQGHVGFTFINAGPMRFGFELGGQVGFLPGHAPPQYAINPGVTAVFRLSPAFAITARFDVPILFTRGLTQYARINPMTDALNRLPGGAVFAPVNRSYTATFGLEAGVGVAYYLTAGFALTAEISPSLYFGDAFFTYPGVAAAAGVLIDYELMP